MVVAVNLSTSLNEGTIANNKFHTTSCNCVVFRLDGIQAGWIVQGQTILMDLFLSKNQSLVLGIIMDGLRNGLCSLKEIL